MTASDERRLIKAFEGILSSLKGMEETIKKEERALKTINTTIKEWKNQHESNENLSEND